MLIMVAQSSTLAPSVHCPKVRCAPFHKGLTLLWFNISDLGDIGAQVPNLTIYAARYTF